MSSLIPPPLVSSFCVHISTFLCFALCSEQVTCPLVCQELAGKVISATPTGDWSGEWDAAKLALVGELRPLLARARKCGAANSAEGIIDTIISHIGLVEGIQTTTASRMVCPSLATNSTGWEVEVRKTGWRSVLQTLVASASEQSHQFCGQVAKLKATLSVVSDILGPDVRTSLQTSLADCAGKSPPSLVLTKFEPLQGLQGDSLKKALGQSSDYSVPDTNPYCLPLAAVIAAAHAELFTSPSLPPPEKGTTNALAKMMSTGGKKPPPPAPAAPEPKRAKR